MKLLARALPVLSLALFACGEGTTLPDGPGGGDNAFEVIVDGETQDFDTTMTAASTDGSTVTIQLTGNRDPIKDAVDDEYAYTLKLSLNQVALLSIVSGSSQTVSASVSYVVDTTSQTTHSLMPEPQAFDLIQGLEFGRTCFCGPEGGSYTVEGELLLTRISPTEVAGTVDFTFEGKIPNDPAAKVEVDGAFDLTIAGAPKN